MLKGFEHIGMTVGNLDRSIEFYQGLLGLKLLLRKKQPNGGEVAFLDAGGGQLEMVCPPGPVAPARQVPQGEAGLRHITIAVDDIEAAYRQLMAAGVTSIEPPRNAFNKEMLAKVGFVLDPDGIVVELAQRN